MFKLSTLIDLLVIVGILLVAFGLYRMCPPALAIFAGMVAMFGARVLAQQEAARLKERSERG
jgi:uncharacterized membrane protein HdeD (DUF308 family)